MSEGEARGRLIGTLKSGSIDLTHLQPWQVDVVAVVATAAMLALRLALDGVVDGEPTLAVFTLPILLSAYLGGLRAGLLATALSCLAANYFLLAPIYSFRVANAAERWDLLFVAVTGVVISVLNEALQKARRRAHIAVRNYQQADEGVRWLASFPDQNPNPIAEFERESGALRYANAVARALIPDLEEDGLRNRWLTVARKLDAEMGHEARGVLRCEVALGKTWHILTLTYLADGQRLRIYGNDITERKRAEEAVRESEELFAKSFRLSPDCMAITRLLDGTVVQANEALGQLWGRTPEQLIGEPVAEYSTWLSEDSRKVVMKTLAETGECLNYEAALRLPHRRLLDFNISSRMITFKGEPCILSVMRDVTERRRIEVAAARLAAIVESSNDAIIGKDLSGTVTSWNAGAEKIFGYTAEEMIGQPVTRLIPADRQHEEDHILSRLKNGDGVRNFDTMRLRKNGSLVDVSIAVSTIRDFAGRIIGASKVARDITERKRAEGTIRESEAHFHFLDDLGEATRSLSDPAEIMAVIARRLGQHLCASRCAYAEVEPDGERFTILHDYTDGCASTVGQYQLSLFGPRAVATMRSGQTLIIRDVQTELAPAEGAEMFKAIGIHAIITCPLVKEGALRAMMAVHQETPRDWTPSEIGMVQDVVERCWATLERRIAEEKLLRLNAQLEHRVSERTAQLEVANKELEAFSYSVSHDLRSPLRAVDGFSQAVLEDYGSQLPEEGQRYLETIRSGAQRMGVLIDDLLTFSRLSRLPLTKQSVDTERQVREILDELKAGREERAVDIRVSELPAYLGDPALVKQVWVNLLSNALKYTRKREQAEVEISARREQGGIVYFVRDNGTGFDMRYAHKLFGVFQRLHRAEEYEGTGVGLAIVQRIVQRHGGRVWAEAAPDQGATFYFTLSGKDER